MDFHFFRVREKLVRTSPTGVVTDRGENAVKAGSSALRRPWGGSERPMAANDLNDRALQRKMLYLIKSKSSKGACCCLFVVLLKDYARSLLFCIGFGPIRARAGIPMESATTAGGKAAWGCGERPKAANDRERPTMVNGRTAGDCG